MGRLCADDTRECSFPAVDYNFLGQQHPLVKTANSTEAQEAFLLNFGDD